MSKSGKWLLILGLVAFLSAIAFGFTVAAYGVQNNDYSISIGGEKFNIYSLGGIGMGNFLPGNAGIHFIDSTDLAVGATRINEDFEANKEYSYSFDASRLDSIEISLASCKAEIICSDTDKADLRYVTGTSKVNFTAESDGNKLTVSERPGAWFNFGGINSSVLILSVPEKVYENIKLDLASGSIKSSGMTSGRLDANVASGKMELEAFAKDIRLDIASGKMIINNCTEDAADSVSIHTASGGVEMKGFRSENTNVDLASGSVNLNGISGKADVDLASGQVTLVYAEWNDDLSIDLASGKVDVTLPGGSGADTKFKRASGSMKMDLDGQSVSLKGESSMTVGGANVHKVDASTLSGNITIHN